jgi:hypothetical protein
MADDNKKKLVEGLDAEFDVLQSKLNNIASLLGDTMRNKLSDLTTEAGNYIDAFENGEDVVKKLTAKLTTLQKESNKLSLNRLKLENDLARVQQQGNLVAERKIKSALLQNKLASQQVDATQTLLIKLKQAADEEAKITEEKRKQNDLGEVAKKKAKEALEPFTKLLSTAGIFEAIWKGLIGANENSVWISKNLGYGAAKADILTDKMQLMSLTADATNVSLKSLNEAMVQLSEATGGVAEYSRDALETQVMLTKQMGLTAEEAAGIYKLGVLNNQTSEQTNKQMIKAFATTRNNVRGSISFKEAMAAASKVSGQLASNLQNNPALITAAVVKMQALGTSLEQTKGQGEKLLDFQSSIESELKAELITGKELNLERARAAALAGDQVTLAEELNKNVGSLADFNKMNVIQQQSLAEAVGLTADQLADQLRKQEVAVQQGKSLAQVNADELEAAQKRKTIQEKFNNFLEKMMDIIGSIGTAFSPFIEAITWLFDHTWAVYTVLGLWAIRSKGIAGTFKGIVDSVKNIGTSIGNKILGKTAAPATPTPAAPTTPAAGGGAGGFMKGINTTDMIKGAAAILILSAALFVAAKAFQEFATVKWEDVAKGVVGIGALAGVAFLLSKASGDMIEGSIAIAILGVALIPFAYALSLLANVKMENVLAAAAGLVIFGAAVFGLGALMMTGAGAFIFGAGILAIIALGGAMIILGAGLQSVANAGTGITALFKSLTELDTDQLTKIAPALLSIGEGIMTLGAGSIMAGIGGLLGGGPVDIIKGIADSGDGIQKAATGLQAMASALQQVSSALSGIDTSKLEALSDFSEKSAASGIVSTILSPIKAIGNMIEGAAGGGNEEMVKAINEVRDAVNKLYNKDQSIHMDGKKVGTTLTQNSYKVA